MRFGDKLKKLMAELEISQKQLSDMTGIGKSSVSQYLSGRNEPSEARRRQIAAALGVQEDYFEMFDPAAEITQDDCVNVPVPVAAALMGKSRAWVMQGLQDGVFPWGYAVRMKKWSYFISSVKFTEHTGIPVPVRQQHESEG